ncbi:MAG: hypothetical protein AAF447_01460 [Myxococcota bacterium]
MASQPPSAPSDDEKSGTFGDVAGTVKGILDGVRDAVGKLGEALEELLTPPPPMTPVPVRYPRRPPPRRRR